MSNIHDTIIRTMNEGLWSIDFNDEQTFEATGPRGARVAFEMVDGLLTIQCQDRVHSVDCDLDRRTMVALRKWVHSNLPPS